MLNYKIILFYVQSPNTLHAYGVNRKILSISQQISLLRESATQCNPNFDLIVLTTPDTPHDEFNFDYERIDCEIDKKCLMRERNRVQFEYIMRNSDDKIPFVILDTDILLNVDPVTLFDEDYDIGLTWRANDEMPINGGVVLVSNRNPSASRAFYRQLYENQVNDPVELAHWFGEQRSMAKIIGLDSSKLANTGKLLKSGVNYRLFPCETHNHTPRYLPVFGRTMSPFILHFKGTAARFMGQYWKYHLDCNSREIPFRLPRLVAERAVLRYKRMVSKWFK
jgi:hypothetical protein